MVREALGIELDGLGVVAHSVNIFFRSAELAAFHDKGWARFYRVIDETGCWSELIPIDGKELWRLTVFDDPASSRPTRGLAAAHMAGGDFAYEHHLGVAVGAARLRRQELRRRSRLHRRRFRT